MQKTVVVLSLAALLGAGALARTYRSETSLVAAASNERSPLDSAGRGDKIPLPADSTGRGDKNPLPAAVAREMSAQLVPSTEAKKHARQLLRDGKFVAAEAECRRAMALSPVVNGQRWYRDILPLLGDILLAQGRNQDALDCYLGVKTSSVPDDQENPRPNLSAALAYCRLGNFKMAKKYCPDKVIASFASPERLADWPGTGDIHALEASLLLVRVDDEASVGHYREAVSYLERAAKLAPKNWVIADSMGRALYLLNRRDEAVPYYKRAVQYGGDKVSDETRQRAQTQK